MSDENRLSRRGLFMKLGILFNGLVATALAVPIVRFLLRLGYSRTRKRLPVMAASRSRGTNFQKVRRAWPRFAIPT